MARDSWKYFRCDDVVDEFLFIVIVVGGSGGVKKFATLQVPDFYDIGVYNSLLASFVVDIDIERACWKSFSRVSQLGSGIETETITIKIESLSAETLLGVWSIFSLDSLDYNFMLGVTVVLLRFYEFRLTIIQIVNYHTTYW